MGGGPGGKGTGKDIGKGLGYGAGKGTGSGKGTAPGWNKLVAPKQKASSPQSVDLTLSKEGTSAQKDEDAKKSEELKKKVAQMQNARKVPLSKERPQDDTAQSQPPPQLRKLPLKPAPVVLDVESEEQKPEEKGLQKKEQDLRKMLMNSPMAKALPQPSQQSQSAYLLTAANVKAQEDTSQSAEAAGVAPKKVLLQTAQEVKTKEAQELEAKAAEARRKAQEPQGTRANNSPAGDQVQADLTQRKDDPGTPKTANKRTDPKGNSPRAKAKAKGAIPVQVGSAQVGSDLSKNAADLTDEKKSTSTSQIETNKDLTEKMEARRKRFESEPQTSVSQPKASSLQLPSQPPPWTGPLGIPPPRPPPPPSPPPDIRPPASDSRPPGEWGSVAMSQANLSPSKPPGVFEEKPPVAFTPPSRPASTPSGSTSSTPGWDKPPGNFSAVPGGVPPARPPPADMPRSTLHLEGSTSAMSMEPAKQKNPATSTSATPAESISTFQPPDVALALSASSAKVVSTPGKESLQTPSATKTVPPAKALSAKVAPLLQEAKVVPPPKKIETGAGPFSPPSGPQGSAWATAAKPVTPVAAKDPKAGKAASTVSTPPSAKRPLESGSVASRAQEPPRKKPRLANGEAQAWQKEYARLSEVLLKEFEGFRKHSLPGSSVKFSESEANKLAAKLRAMQNVLVTA